MNSKLLMAGLVLSALMSGGARASTIFVENASFETLPVGGLDQTGCAPGCSYSVGNIPGWNVTGSSGQFIPGATPAYFNSVPDGVTVAYTNGAAEAFNVIGSSLTIIWILVISIMLWRKPERAIA